MMFIHRYNELEAKWIGAMYDEEYVLNKSGMKEIYYLDEFESFIDTNINRFNILYLDLERDDSLTLHTQGQLFYKHI